MNTIEVMKPCPFCGGPAEIDTMQGYLNFSNGRMENAIAIYCTECGADISVCRGDVPDIQPEQVAEMWNKRALEAQQAEIEELRADKERLDWLESSPRHAQIMVDGEAMNCVFYGISCVRLMRLREAIDAARRK